MSRRCPNCDSSNVEISLDPTAIFVVFGILVLIGGVRLFADKGDRKPIQPDVVTARSQERKQDLVQGPIYGLHVPGIPNRLPMYPDQPPVSGARPNSSNDRVLPPSQVPLITVPDLHPALPAVHVNTQFQGRVVTATVCSDGSKVAIASEDKVVRILSAHNGDLLHTLIGHSASIRAVTFSADGTHVASTSDDHSGRVWNATTGKVVTSLRKGTGRIAITPGGISPLEGHTGPIRAAAFSPDASRIVSGGDDRVGRLWDTLTGELRGELKGHTGAIVSVAYSGDGTRVVTASEDRTARVWDAAGKSVMVLQVTPHSFATRCSVLTDHA